ncbi:MAG: CoA-binding protein [Candidatus Rokubacteria bacterium]|nr:CoA-binding protein [Candidatus Rokubacteria bacterium]
MPADVRTALDLAFAPGSVAIIGASANPAKFGYRIVEYLIKGGFTGRLYPVNPRGEPICGLPSFASLASVPGAVDLAALLVPAAQAVEAVRHCAARGVRVAVVIASGFAEAGQDGARNQAEMAAVARASGMRLVGPNCEGLINLHKGFVLSFSMMFLGQTPGPISFISQSGAYCGIVSSRLSRAGVGAAKVVSSGNEGDLAAVDYLEYLGDDPDTRVILAHLEGIRDPRRFSRVIGEVAARKPLVVNKTGRTETGRRQAASHTGALAGNDRVLSALLSQRGVVRTRHMDELVDAGLALASQPLLRGSRVAILSTAGGLAVEMSDLLVEAGFVVPTLGTAAQEVLRGRVPWFGTIANPIDFTGSMITEPGAVGECLDAVLADPGIDAVAFVLTAVGDPEFARVVHRRILERARPILICWTAGRERAGEALAYFTARGVPVYESTVGLVQGLSALREYWRFRLGGEFREETGA